MNGLAPTKNILVTGGSGFIGSHFVRKMVLEYPDYNIVNLDKLDYCATTKNNEDVSRYRNYTFIKGDITVFDLVKFVVVERQIDTIVHFAAQSHVDNSFGNSFDFTHNNVMGTHVLLEVAKTCGIKRFIHISTDEVYGEVETGASDLSEKSLLAPTNPYAASKAAAEMLVHSYVKSFDLPVIITRSNNVYGPHQYPEKVIPKFISMLDRGLKCCIHGDGTHTRRYIYATDVADAIDLILHQGVVGETYNIGTTFEISNRQLATVLAKEMGLSTNIDDIAEFGEDRQFNDRRYAIDSDKLEQLGWSPKIEFDVGIKRTIQWYRENSQKFWGEFRKKESRANPKQKILEPVDLKPLIQSELIKSKVGMPCNLTKFSWETEISESELLALSSTGKLPKILHQSWKSTTLPQNYLKWALKWRALHPEYKWILWTDDDNRLLVERYYPEFLSVYDMFPRNIMRIDIVRVLYMHRYGGLYADLDMIPVKDNSILFEKYPNQNVFLAKMGEDEDFEHNIPNAWMASKPGHKFWVSQLFLAAQRCYHFIYPEITSGPILLRDAFYQWKKLGDLSNDIQVFEPGYIYGIDWYKGAYPACDFDPKLATDELLDNCIGSFTDIYALTIWTHSWE